VVTDDPSDYDSIPSVQRHKVGRRYRDFLALYEQLLHHVGVDVQNNRNPNSAAVPVLVLGGPVLPTLPPKTTRVPGLTRNTQEDHAETRRKALQLWLRHIISHPALRASPPLRNFLTQASKNVNYSQPPDPLKCWVPHVEADLGALTTKTPGKSTATYERDTRAKRAQKIRHLICARARQEHLVCARSLALVKSTFFALACAKQEYLLRAR
jgi:hypothetical protein